MIVNESIPGLPVWPPIERLTDGEYVVHTKRMSYVGFHRALYVFIVINFILVGANISGAYFGDEMHCPWILFGIAALVLFIGGMRTILLISHLFFRPNVRVCFSPRQIIVNGVPYDVGLPISVQFRASTFSMPEEDIEEKRDSLRKTGHYHSLALNFRDVEMIYGSRIVFVASIENNLAAEQFAVGLQCAYDRAKSHRKSTNDRSSREYDASDSLPE